MTLVSPHTTRYAGIIHANPAYTSSPTISGTLVPTTTGATWSWHADAAYTVYDCGIHDLRYRATIAGCPVCDRDRELQSVREALKAQTNELALIKEESQNLRVQVDMVSAIREAAVLLSQEDMAFFKLALYQWRDEKSINVRPTKNRRGSINGLLLMHRSEDPIAIECNSVGGLAIAEYLGEAINTYGSPKAMEIMTRALSPYLPGSLNEV